ncbi:hypothetical protein B0H15DRAFT_848346 [Mycena belliarum]|uniref:Uncharacterized protein n=1 Tax=Mycena belliarum TaxID=1033014 RepID=A0AAD6U0I3_9AGAR|nr:hypothetical protein B0H15DRAFT_848346 [Mycena belliae]
MVMARSILLDAMLAQLRARSTAGLARDISASLRDLGLLISVPRASPHWNCGVSQTPAGRPIFALAIQPAERWLETCDPVKIRPKMAALAALGGT